MKGKINYFVNCRYYRQSNITLYLRSKVRQFCKYLQVLIVNNKGE